MEKYFLCLALSFFIFNCDSPNEPTAKSPTTVDSIWTCLREFDNSNLMKKWRLYHTNVASTGDTLDVTDDFEFDSVGLVTAVTGVVIKHKMVTYVRKTGSQLFPMYFVYKLANKPYKWENVVLDYTRYDADQYYYAKSGTSPVSGVLTIHKIKPDTLKITEQSTKYLQNVSFNAVVK